MCQNQPCTTIRGAIMKPSMRAIIAAFVLLAAGGGHAHTPVPAPDCVAPKRPPEDVPEPVWQTFLTDVDCFRACITRYVQENHAASDAHRAAGNQATLLWNDFVRASLNVPEDYPWPPEPAFED